MTRSMRWSLALAAVPAAVLMAYFGLVEEARRTLAMTVVAVAAGGLPALWSLYVMGQKLEDAERDAVTQERLSGDLKGGVEEMRGYVEKQLGAIEETAASLHQ